MEKDGTITKQERKKFTLKALPYKNNLSNDNGDIDKESETISSYDDEPTMQTFDEAIQYDDEALENVYAATTLHAVLVADTYAPSSGLISKRNLRKMKNLIKSISNNTGFTLKGYTISGRVSSNNVIAVLNKLLIKKDDVVIFYYSGYGFNNGFYQSIWPSMALDGGDLPFKCVISTLQRKKPRFFIAIADTNNKLVDNKRDNRYTFEDCIKIFSKNVNRNINHDIVNHNRYELGKYTQEANNYRQLFLNYHGSLVASSSKQDQYSWGIDRNVIIPCCGFFTERFLESLNKELRSDNPNWQSIMKRATAPIHVEGSLQEPQYRLR